MEHNLKNFSFDQYAGKHAHNQFKLWHFSKEWRLGIIILSIIKVITWIISIYAGYYFIYKTAYPVIGIVAASAMVAVVLLVTTELLTWFFLSKFFKFLLKKIIGTAVFAGVIAVAIYGLSFYITTNGLAMRQADKVDKTELIVNNSDEETSQIHADYSARMMDYRTEIQTIKANPQGWINGKLKRLSAQQLADIKQMNIIIDSLGRQMKTEIAAIGTNQQVKLDENIVITTAEADKYHSIVVVVMIIQAICNFLLMFSWSRIFSENDTMESVHEDLAQVKNTIRYNFFENLAASLFEDANTFIQAQNYQKKEIPFEVVHTEPAQVIGFAKTEVKTETPNIGFKQQTTEPVKPTMSQQLLGKLRTHDVLRYTIKKIDTGEINWKEKQVLKQCNVKKWKLHEFKNLMKSAGMINETPKNKNV